MVARGLKALENPRRVGIAALMAECSVQKGSRSRRAPSAIRLPAYQRCRAHGRGRNCDRAVSDARRGTRGRAGGRALPPQPPAAEIESSIYQSAVAMLPPGAAAGDRAGGRELAPGRGGVSWPPAWRRNTAARRSSSASTATRVRPRRGPPAGSTCSGRWSSCPACLKATAGMNLPPDLLSGASIAPFREKR